MIVVEQNAGGGIAGYIDVRPTVVVEISGEGREAVIWSRSGHSGFIAGVAKRPVAVIVVELVSCALQTAGAAHDRNPLPTAETALPRNGRLCGIKIDVLGDEQVQAAVTVIVDEGASGAPAQIVMPQSRFPCDVNKGPVTIAV